MAIYRRQTTCRICGGADLVEILGFGQVLLPTGC